MEIDFDKVTNAGYMAQGWLFFASRARKFIKT